MITSSQYKVFNSGTLDYIYNKSNLGTFHAFEMLRDQALAAEGAHHEKLADHIDDNFDICYARALSICRNPRQGIQIWRTFDNFLRFQYLCRSYPADPGNSDAA